VRPLAGAQGVRGLSCNSALAPSDQALASDEALERPWLRHNVTTSQHISGTCKMGSPPQTPLTVVDQLSLSRLN